LRTADAPNIDVAAHHHKRSFLSRTNICDPNSKNGSYVNLQANQLNMEGIELDFGFEWRHSSLKRRSWPGEAPVALDNHRPPSVNS